MSITAVLVPALRLSAALVAAPIGLALETAALTTSHGPRQVTSRFLHLCPPSASLSSCNKTVQGRIAHVRSPYLQRDAHCFSTNACAFTLPPLPYAEDALAPHISAETLRFHHGKHHAAYVNKLNGFIQGTPFADKTLEDIVKNSSGAIFNNAAQAWNHEFYFKSMKPASAGGGGEPDGLLKKEIEAAFSSFAQFKDEFSKLAAGHFGSGWAWIVWDKQQKKIVLEQTHDANTPITDTMKVPLLCCDVWEHAYYLDKKNDRPAYIEGWWSVVNWGFAAENLVKALESN
ncbi:superoxide dismutase SOD2 [Toxoplasma gondii TgCatPRC2]|uniref:Superoxide dismutase [Fe] n=13 Tax=Toxoplasma gondii TaxID=5811 RepID=A0A0F7VAX6_TOXGV|nr:superoxide dismutase SOD2 [Toxoplasma gondii ME49]AAO18663.1 iron-containing superoxide dismutase [Toxoplasma gondii]ESS35269.1 superoxide dismutase SOD2 [Toxoplasma gondii VEG]KFG36628.1 superoxide dismutase SOD2 [Toxoplasma gondii GAB2-2007-GAL-DOM2]KFG49304.1 superoxide dismutase SOD2 [Toxoplasma gondii p89]KFG56430.1 superoxide dismutase SOD2 [Toxoplasma gondii FOU]KFG66432.1 superoxide dismutase SOD2 [Toxoplasma gondii RUB]KFH01959.1 superoxide dismutase SOD2 [Toxoplasma gondii VAND]|eukprot:XP_002364800.1 superoxide dismutase SOD2 [Toxoplasma gondii ME49]